jgi:UPF0755 protein
MKRTTILTVTVIALTAAALLACAAVAWIPNTHFTGESRRFFIPEKYSAEEVISKLSREGVIRRSRTLRILLQFHSVDSLPAGRYRLSQGMSNLSMARMFVRNEQEPVIVHIRHLRDVSRISGQLARYLRADSAAFAACLLNPQRADSAGLSSEQWPSRFIAGDYTMWWTDSPEQVMSRFDSAYLNYWTEERLARAASLGLSPPEVYTLASIVKGETVKMAEAPRIAGLYHNRLRTGMPLQADPTVIFAQGREFVGQVLFRDLKVDSPYNTYLHPGLPPGPIAITEPAYLDAALEPENHAYIYMCAKPGAIGEHAFASTYSEHLRNAEAYRTWLRSVNN